MTYNRGGLWAACGPRGHFVRPVGQSHAHRLIYIWNLCWSNFID